MNKDRIDKRRNKEGSLYQSVTNDLVIRRNPLKKQQEHRKKVKQSKAEYTFLQYHYPVWKWAIMNYKLTDRELNVILYLYPLITFTFEEFEQALKELGSSDKGTLSKLKKKGMIQIWSVDGRINYFVLTNKANTLVSRMHKMLMMEEQIPTSERRNVLYRKKDKKSQDLMSLFAKFNKKVIEKKK